MKAKSGISHKPIIETNDTTTGMVVVIVGQEYGHAFGINIRLKIFLQNFFHKFFPVKNP